MLNLKIGPLEETHLQEALILVVEGYEEEKKELPYLPEVKDLEEIIRKNLIEIYYREKGFVAIKDGEVMGFMIGYSVEKFFGSCRGVSVPLFGHGARKENRQEIYEDLYTLAAKKWVEEEKYTHALTVFANDKESIENWFWLGFGLRCVDAIRKTTPKEIQMKNLELKKAGLKDLPGLTGLYEDHRRYHSQSPIFMLKSCRKPLKEMEEWLLGENHHLWYAVLEGKPAGYIQIEPEGETFISRHPSVMNITGAFVEEEKRGLGVGEALLAEVQAWLGKKGYPLCGVDFEAFNISGRKFWNRFFNPYTFSLVRGIDERVGC